MSVEEEEKRAYKVILIGDSAVGKTCILKREEAGVFYEDAMPTIENENVSIHKIVDSQQVDLQIHDTAGQEKFRSITSFYVRGSQVVIIVYDITQRNSFNSIDDWIEFVQDILPVDSFRIVLAGNKIDCRPDDDNDNNNSQNDDDDSDNSDSNKDQNDFITLKEGQKKAESLNVPFFEVSAKTGENIDELFCSVAQQCLNIQLENKKVIQLDDPNKKCGC